MPSPHGNWQRRRKVLPGFPWDGKFTTKEEVYNYLSGDRIQCLLCGKWYKQLGQHLTIIHKVSAEDYKMRYGLPWVRGLTCAETHQAKSEIVKQRIADGFSPGGDAERMLKLANAPRRPRAPYLEEVCVDNIAKMKHVHQFYSAENYEELIQRMVEQERTYYEVCEDEDMPGKTALNEYRRKNPEYAERLKKAFEQLPFEVLARAESVKNLQRFQNAVKCLKAKGLTFKEVASKLGVSPVTAVRASWEYKKRETVHKGENS